MGIDGWKIRIGFGPGAYCKPAYYIKMHVSLRSAQNTPNDFFSILPEDWRCLIAPYWEGYKANSTIYVLENHKEIVGGGIVFASASPDMTHFEKTQGKVYFDLGYLYIGFLWVIPEYRGRELGSKWLSLLKEQNKNQSYWLTIEEENLKAFYKKNGFECVAESDSTTKEWLLVYKSK